MQYNELNQKIEEYIKKYNYDINDEQIKLKQNHMKRVALLSKKLATSLRLSKEDIELSYLIGLLHDIGRFEQIDKYHTFLDKDSINHGKLGCEILFDNNEIREFIDDTNYDYIIKTAILNHNTPGIDESISEQEKLHCKILRDADKTDILYLSSLTDNNTIFGEKENGFFNEFSEEVYLEFLKNQKIDYQNINNSSDILLCHLQYIFDYNYDCLLEYTYLNNYIDKLYRNIRFENIDISNKFHKCYTLTKKYMKDRLNK